MRRLTRLSLFILLTLLFPSPFLFAQTEPGETLTIATYYPSPYGYYKNFDTFGETHLATEGGNVGIGTTAPEAKLDVDGQIYTARSVIYKPQDSLPLSDTKKGELVYNNADNQLYVYKGATEGWRPVGTGSICYTGYGSCAPGYTIKDTVAEYGWSNWGQWSTGQFIFINYLVGSPPGRACGPSSWNWGYPNPYDIGCPPGPVYVCCKDG